MWKLLRAVWFAADFASNDTAAERRTYERALAIADGAFAQLAARFGGSDRLAGLVQAVRGGVANRLHEAALRSLALDPGVERGGALRLLSRLHSEAPARCDEALRLIEATAALEPRADQVIEDLAIRIDARERLSSEAKHG